MLEVNKEKIEEILGEFSWVRLNERNACRIAVYTEFTNDIEMLLWAVSKLKSFRECFKEYLT